MSQIIADTLKLIADNQDVILSAVRLAATYKEITMATLKISDLSVGDWVRTKEGNVTVDIISPLEVVVMNDYGNLYAYKIEEIEPIPITAEILKNNGWYEDDYDTCTDYVTDNALIMYNKERKDWKACIMNNSPVVRVKVFFSYVHELQHALRLAGVEKEISL